MNAAALQPELEDAKGRPLVSGNQVWCVNRNGANKELGTVSHELDAILARPLNHKLRLTGVLNLGGRKAKKQYLVFSYICLQEFKAGKMVKRTDDELAVLLFGELQKRQGVISMKRLYRALNVKHDHLYDLTNGRKPAFELADGSNQRRGPGGSAMVEWAEVVRFIKERRVA